MIALKILGILVFVGVGAYLLYDAFYADLEKWFIKFMDTSVKKTTETFTTIGKKVEEKRHGVKTKSRDGEKITEWERNYLWEGFTKRKRVPCINCEVEDMYEGPQGGMSTNWRCPNCGQGINLTLIGQGKNDFWCDNIGIDKYWINDKAKTRSKK